MGRSLVARKPGAWINRWVVTTKGDDRIIYGVGKKQVEGTKKSKSAHGVNKLFNSLCSFGLHGPAIQHTTRPLYGYSVVARPSPERYWIIKHRLCKSVRYRCIFEWKCWKYHTNFVGESVRTWCALCSVDRSFPEKYGCVPLLSGFACALARSIIRKCE